MPLLLSQPANSCPYSTHMMMALRGAAWRSSATHGCFTTAPTTPVCKVLPLLRSSRQHSSYLRANANTSIQSSDTSVQAERRGSHSTASSSHSSPTASLEPPAGSSAAPTRADGPRPSANMSAQQLQQLWQYLDYLLEVNKVMNLTAIRERDEAWERHIEDSLALLPVIQQHLPRSGTGSISVIDVGTGAGLPGMVFAIARPQWRVTLLDSLRKRCDFLDQAAVHAGVRNVRTVWCRAEDGGQQPKLRQVHDLAVARAVADTRVLAELCLPFVRQGGIWVAAKGASPQAEVDAAGNAIKQVGGRLLGVELVDSYAPEGQRTAVVVAKVMPTPRKYPRQAGTPSKKPL